MELNSILIGSENPDRLAEYYTKLFGEPQWNDGGYVGWQIGAGSVTVGPHDQVKGKNTEPGRVIWNIQTGDVKGDFDRLREAGATVVAGALPSRGARGHARDVDRDPRRSGRQLFPAHEPDVVG